MRWRVAVFGTVGAVATALAAAFVFAPDLLLGVRPVGQTVRQLSGADPKSVLLAATLVVGLYVAIAARSATSERTLTEVSEAEQRFDGAVADPPEAVTTDRQTVTAADVDADIARAIDQGGDRLQAVREVLATLVAETYAEQHRLPLEDGRRAVATGEWTDDAVAAAFLGDGSGPSASLLSRIRLWLTPERERERRIDRALTALADLMEDSP